MTALIGPQGIAVGAIITLLIGNPISAAAQRLRDEPMPLVDPIEVMGDPAGKHAQRSA